MSGVGNQIHLKQGKLLLHLYIHVVNKAVNSDIKTSTPKTLLQLKTNFSFSFYV